MTLMFRESFWQKDQSEEKMRILAEREKKIEETKGMDKERRQREEVEGRVREEQIKERERVVAHQRQQEKKSNDKVKEQSSWEEQREADARDAEERAQRSDVMRRERKEEAQELIRQGGGQAKMVFQRNSSQVIFVCTWKENVHLNFILRKSFGSLICVFDKMRRLDFRDR